MKRKTIADQIEIRPDGSVQVRFGKLILNDDDTLAAEPQWHRTVFAPDTPIDDLMNLVNQDLVRLGEAPVEASCIERIKAHAAVARTPEAVAAYVARSAALVEKAGNA